MLTLPEHLISPLVFIIFMLSCHLCLLISCDSLGFWLFLLFNCLVSIFFTCISVKEDILYALVENSVWIHPYEKLLIIYRWNNTFKRYFNRNPKQLVTDLYVFFFLRQYLINIMVIIRMMMKMKKKKEWTYHVYLWHCTWVNWHIETRLESGPAQQILKPLLYI